MTITNNRPKDTVETLEDGLGYVSLLQVSGDDTGVVNAARVSFGKRIEEIGDGDRRLIRFLLQHQHGTPFEHNSLTFLVKCPLFVARQWHRHRVGISINEISGRYVELKEEFYLPREFRIQAKHNRQASAAGEFDQATAERAKAAYQAAIDTAYQNYQQLLAAGVAREQARAVLPLATYTEYYWTCNLRSLMHFVRLRNHADAQWEIQQYAQAMLSLAKPHFPVSLGIWEELGLV